MSERHSESHPSGQPFERSVSGDSPRFCLRVTVRSFFEDDFDSRQGEAFVGSVDFIRIHEDTSTLGTAPVPLPAAT